MLQPITRYGTLRNRHEDRNALLKVAVDLVDKYPLEHAFQPVVKAMYALYTVSHDIAYFEQCLKAVQAVGQPQDIAFCHWTTGIAHKLNNQHSIAMTHFEQARALYAAQQAAFEEATVLQSISECLLAAGEVDQAVAVIEVCLEIRRKIKDLRGEGAVLVQLGSIHMVRANYDQAEHYWQRARENIKLVLGDARAAPEITTALALVSFLRGEDKQAYELAQETYNVAIEYNIPDYQGFALAILAVVMVGRGAIDKAQAYIAEMDTLVVDEFDYWIEADKYWARSLVAMASNNLVAAKRWCHAALQVGLTSGGTLMIWSLPVAALIAAHEGRVERAVELLALALHHPTSAKQWLEKWAFFKARQVELQAKLGTDYQAAWQRGMTLDLAATVAAEIKHLEISS
jgi:tetratricopeptide (TPR) repeat protein